ncbi:MAG TPA: helix-turn-helix domain-containing protein [Patescibacteria group bacterium]|nr:helix-turn-helix domain-containing protein [Patescibacteria group bacterium]
MDSLLSVRQVAFILKVHQLTIRRYIKDGRLKAVKVGGNVRIKEQDLSSFHKDLFTATPQQAIIIKAKKGKVEKPFGYEDPFLKLSGRGASLT